MLVCGDNLAETDETFLVNLSGEAHATLADGQGLGTITNEDAAPVVDAGGPYSGSEGSWVQLTGSATDVDDPGTLTLKWTYAAGSGVDALATCEFDNDAIANPKFRCTDDGTWVVTLTASDGTNSRSDTADVVLANADPVLSLTSPAFAAQYAMPATVNVVAPFTDTGSNDSHTCLINWDDGSPSEQFPASGGNCNKTHVYTAPGVYTITVRVTDDDGGYDIEQTMVLVYDPTGGFITGGGWIDSPAGAYTPQNTTDTDVTGRANFGFVAKYKKGLAEGQTEFQFKAGNMNFHSEAYTALIVSGYKAQFRGTGTVNGVSGYKFVLTAYDGQVNGGGGTDRFRIRITTSSGTVLYDNRYGQTDDMDEIPMAISQGSIVIHK